MPLMQHFSNIDKAILVTTGNSLVVCGSNTDQVINTSELIMLDGNTTRDWQECGSSANLNVLEGSTILYAELIWYSTVYSNEASATDLRSIEDNEIIFRTPKGTYNVRPQYTESYTGSSNTVDRYRALDVTEYIIEGLSGDYSVSRVPISIPKEGLSNSRGGWALVVIYRNDEFAPQKIIYNSGISVATKQQALQSTLTDFTTGTKEENLRASISFVAANAGPFNEQNIVSIGPSFARLQNVGNDVFSPSRNPSTAPNNPGNRFFSGAINVANPISKYRGLLDINGTNGNDNHDGFIPEQNIGARNKWDITNVDISKTLIKNQTLLAGQLTCNTENDGILVLMYGAQVLTKAPNIVATLRTDNFKGDNANDIEVGETIVYTAEIKNSGDMAAENLIVMTELDNAVSFINSSVVINGVSSPNSNIVKGINLGTLNPKGIITLQYSAKVNELPENNKLIESVDYSYQFKSGRNTSTNRATTNEVETAVRQGLVSLEQKASKSSVRVGDTLTYKVNINNNGTENLRNIFYQSDLDLYSSFVASSVLIDSVGYRNYNPVEGFLIENLNVGENTTIEFDVKIDDLPPSEEITNTSYASIEYIYSGYNYPRNKTISSNTITTQVLFSEIVSQRCKDNMYADIGDIETYQLNVTNIGNIEAMDVQILEPKIEGAKFVESSVKVNGIRIPEVNPFEGFVLEEPINPDESVLVEYDVEVESLSKDSLIENMAQVPFKYQISPSSEVVESTRDSNLVDTHAKYVCMEVMKSVDKEYAKEGDILYYKVEVRNTGNLDSIDTFFIDIIQEEASFIEGSVEINGVSYKSYNPNEGFSIGTVCPDESVEVSFEVRVDKMPRPNVIYNDASLQYSYKPDPDKDEIIDKVSSNTVKTVINEAKYSIVKSVDKEYAQVGDPIIYTTVIKNIGTVELKDVKFADYTNTHLDLYEGTVYINGVNYPEYNPNEQFDLGNINFGETITITFATKLKEHTILGYVPNLSEVTLSYKVNPDEPTIRKTEYSNTVKTYDPYAELDIVKNVDKEYAVIGDILTYSFDIINKGNSSSNDTFFSDKIQNEASFIDGTVKINGIIRSEFNPEDGFVVGKLERGEVIRVEFKVRVDRIPRTSTIKNNALVSYNYYIDPEDKPVVKTTTSNTVTTTINDYSASLTKFVDKQSVLVDEILEYKVIARNTGTVDLENVNFKDVLVNELEFIEGSVIVDGVNLENANPNIGFNISNVIAGAEVVVTFKARVIEIPQPPRVDNTANIDFRYKLSPELPYQEETLTSNTVSTNVVEVDVNNQKYVDKEYTTVGENLLYTSVITNNSNIDMINSTFRDTVPSNTVFVPNTVRIDNVEYPEYNPNIGFDLGTILSKQSITVSFEVRVESRPNRGRIYNVSTINYQYKIDEEGFVISENKRSNRVQTVIVDGNLDISKSANRTITKLNNIIEYSVVVENTGSIILRDLIFRDIIQEESSFNQDSVYIDSVQQIGLNPNDGFNIGDLDIGDYKTITFSVTTDSIPQDNRLLNNANVQYSYYIDPQEEPVTENKDSNTTVVEIFDTIVSANKSVDKSIAKIDDILTFEVTMINDGNVLAENIVFEDILDENIVFIENSVYIDNVQQRGFNPNEGFILEDIPGGESRVVRFDARIISRPSDNTVYNFANATYQYTINGETIEAEINTNITETTVATGELEINKFVDRTYATLDDTIYYNVIVENTGSVDAVDLLFRDIVPVDTSFILGSLEIDGRSVLTFDPNEGFNLSDLRPNEYHTISFAVNVDSIPENNMVENTSDITFSYRLTPQDPLVTETLTSNNVITNINVGELTIDKEVDKQYSTLEDILTYKVTVRNVGNVKSSEIFINDLLQKDIEFVEGSLKIDNIPYAGYNPNEGFRLDDLEVGESTVIEFDATVKTVPENNIVNNSAFVNYSYYIDPDESKIVEILESNMVETTINVGSLDVEKLVDKDYASIDDRITYTVNIYNSGSTVAKLVNFRDVIADGLTFVEGSVTINNESYPSYNPYSSFPIKDIEAGYSVVVKFDAIVTSLPDPSLAENKASITFAYKIDPEGEDITEEVETNTVTTQINVGKIEITKNVDKEYAQEADILTYSFVVKNTGNVVAENVIFTDDLSPYIEFEEGSVIVDSVPQLDFNPEEGFNLGDIQPLSSVEISFEVLIIGYPENYVIINYALASMQYKIDPEGQYYNSSFESNNVYTTIIVPVLNSRKLVDKRYATLQDNLNYNVFLQNEGNTAIKDLYFTDFLSDGAVFKNGSVSIDGVNYPNYDPMDGFDLPQDIPTGLTSLIQFDAIVNTMPSPPVVTNYAVTDGFYSVEPQGEDYEISTTSNIVETNINLGELTNTKTVDKEYSKVGDILNYTSTLVNTGNVNLTDLYFTDVLQSELSFISGSIKIDNVEYPRLSLEDGFELSDLAPRESIVVSFRAKINALPTPPYVTNTSKVDFSYKIDPQGTPIIKEQESNTVRTNVVLGKLNVKKSVDKTIATTGDEIKYTVTLTNVGNVVNNNVFFRDIPTEGVEFKENSLMINDEIQEGYNPIEGFNLGDIGIGNVVKVSFVVIVTSVPSSNKVDNQAVANFEYLVDPKQKPQTDTTYSNTVTTDIVYANISVTKQVNKRYATIGDELIYSITIVNEGNIDSTDVVFIDDIPENTMFVPGSVTINGTPYIDYSPAVGFDLGTMVPQQIITVAYKVKVVDLC